MYVINSGPEKLEILHDAGFFSILSIRLEGILAYYRATGKPPVQVCTKNTFKWYRNNDEDFANSLFEEIIPHKLVLSNDNPRIIRASTEPQFSDYSGLCYDEIKQIISTYFHPVEPILSYKKKILDTINSNDRKTLGVVYRGTDKSVETDQPNFDEFLKTVEAVIKAKKIDQIYAETDEINFLAALQAKFENLKVFYVRRDGKRNRENIVPYFASVLALSTLNYLVTTSGNGEMWIRLFRGSNRHTIQFLKPPEKIWGLENPHYNPNEKKYWFGDESIFYKE